MNARPDRDRHHQHDVDHHHAEHLEMPIGRSTRRSREAIAGTRPPPWWNQQTEPSVAKSRRRDAFGADRGGRFYRRRERALPPIEEGCTSAQPPRDQRNL